MLPTIHPSIVQLASQRNGLHPTSFNDHLTALFTQGFAEGADPLGTLTGLISLGEREMAFNET